MCEDASAGAKGAAESATAAGTGEQGPLSLVDVPRQVIVTVQVRSRLQARDQGDLGSATDRRRVGDQETRCVH